MPPIKNQLCIISLCVPLFAATFAAPVFAQSNIPSAAETSRAVPNAQQTPLDFNKVKKSKLKSTSARSNIPSDANRVSFVMQDFNIQGMTAYSDQEAQKLYAPYLGKRITKAVVFDIAQSLQEKYAEDGYTISKVIVPDQNFKDGRIQLVVVEGYVAEVEIKDGVLPGRVIDDAVARMKAMRPLNTKKLERLMLVLNALPGTKMAAILATPKTSAAPGAIRLILESVPIDRVSGLVNINNYGSLFSGPVQLSGSVDIAHAAFNYANLNAALTAAAPVNELAFGALKYSFPVFGASGAKLSFNAVAAHTEPGDTLKDLELRGNTREGGVALSYPIWLQRDRSWVVETGFNAKRSKMKISGDRLYDDRLRVAMAGSSFTYADSVLGVNAIDLKVFQGLDILGARESGAVDLSRELGRSDFTKYQATIGRRQALPRNFEGYIVLDGQYTKDPLLSSEEFGFGGAGTGRGYDPSEITGDRGVSMTVELRYNHAIEKYQSMLQPYVFYDVGKVWNIDPGAKDKTSAASVGLGLRLSLKDDWAFESMAAVPLTRPADNPPSYTNPEGVRVLFSVTRKF